MNKKEEAALTMFRAVESHCDNNPAIVGSLVAFQASLDAFKAKIALLISTEQLISTPIAGVSVDKYVSKRTLCQLASDVASFVYAFASVTGNNTLREQVNFRVNTLKKQRDDQLSPLCQNIHDLGAANLGEVKNYGLTTEALNTLQTAITTFSAATPKPRTAQTEKKVQRANLAVTVRDATLILRHQMDRMVIAFKAANPDFVNQYFANRIIIDPSTTTTKIVGIVTNMANNTVIKDAQITATGTSGAATGIIKTAKSTTLGKYTLKPLPPGDYTISIAKPNFTPFEQTEFQAKLGMNNHLDVAMKPN